MQYVYLNLKNGIIKDLIIFILMIISMVVSVIVILFSFGLYHHMEQKKIDAKFGQKAVSMNFVDDTYQVTTKSAVLETCKDLPEEVLSQCYFYATARLKGEERIEDHDVDIIATLSLYYAICDDRVTAADIGTEWKEQGALTKGEWFSAEQVENGELVCIVMDPSIQYVYSSEADELYGKQFELDKDGKCTFDGKKYTPIGYMRGGPMPIVPITTVDNDIYISGLSIVFENVVSREMYDQIKEVFDHHFGNKVAVSKMTAPDVDGEKFYGTLMITCVAMATLSGVIVAVLYEYILLQRKRRFAIFRVCGLTLHRARRMCLMECMIIGVLSYGIAILFFEWIVRPSAQKVYIYIGQSYSLKTYAVLGGMYLGIMLLVLEGMLFFKMQRNVLKAYYG